MNCRFATHRTQADGLHVHLCPACNRESWPTKYPPALCHRHCTADPQPGPPRPFLPRAWSYAKAIARWITAGRPTRDPAEIERIYLEICTPCRPHFVEGKCRACGCAINRDPNGLKNKLAMATEHCPLKKW